MFVQWMRSVTFVNPNLLQQVYNLCLFVGMVGISDIGEERELNKKKRRRRGVGKVHETECKFKSLLLMGFSEICVMTIPITWLLPCGRVHNYSAFFLLFKANLWPVESGSVFLFLFFFNFVMLFRVLIILSISIL